LIFWKDRLIYVSIVTLAALKIRIKYMSNYSCKCPVPGCDFVSTVKAGGREEAIAKFYKEGEKHIVRAHPDFPEMTVEEAYEYVLKCMKESRK